MFLSDDEIVMLRTVADARGLTASDLFRSLMRDAFARFAKEHGRTSDECLETVRHRIAPKDVSLLDVRIRRRNSP